MCEDAPCCGCCGPEPDNSGEYVQDDHYGDEVGPEIDHMVECAFCGTEVVADYECSECGEYACSEPRYRDEEEEVAAL